MQLDQFIVPLGISTYSLLFITVILGLLRKKLKITYKIWVSWHATFGIGTAILGTIHAILNILGH